MLELEWLIRYPFAGCFLQREPQSCLFTFGEGSKSQIHRGSKRDSLHAAAVHGHVEASELLLDHCADENLKTETYGTALQVAYQGDHTRLARVLIDHGARNGPLDEQSHMPLHHACLVGDKILVDTPLKRGATVVMEDADCCTALHYAASNDHTVATALLLRYGADPSTQDNFGARPPFRAAGLTHTEVFKMLIRAGAEVDPKDHYGKTALHGPFHDAERMGVVTGGHVYGPSDCDYCCEG